MRLTSLIIFLASTLVTASSAKLRESFQSPPPEARAHTWWHWMDGNVTREGITADLESMASSHLGGVTLFNLAGPYHNCDIPKGPVDYLSPRWFDLLEHAVDEAERLGLEFGMHNCAGWATTGGPWITPELAMQQLVSAELTVEGGRTLQVQLPQPEVTLGYYRDVAVFAVPSGTDTGYQIYQWPNKAGQRATRSNRQPELEPKSEGLAIPSGRVIELTDRLDEEGKVTWDAPGGSWKLIRIGHTPTGKINKPAPEAGTGLEIDKLRREGLDLHWQKGIRPVLDRLGEQVGTVFNHILIDSYEAGLHHWTPGMRESFRQRRGYDIGPYLLALTGRVVESVPHTERFYWDYRRTIADLFNENYYGYMAELCHEHGLRFATEPYTSTFEGLQAGSRADIPMGEFWVDGRYFSSLRTAASIAHTLRRPVAAAEAFTAGPELGRWQNHPASLKEIGDRAWTTGINRLVLHGWVHQPWLDLKPGMTMGQYGSHFGRTNTWWEPGAEWLAYLARSQFLLQYGEPVNDILCFAGNAAPNSSVNRPDLDRAGYGYDSCSSEAFLSLEVDEGELVLPSGVRYRALVLPENDFHTPAHARKLRELVAAGARIYGPRPRHTPSLENFPESEKEVAAIGAQVWDDAGSETGVMNGFGKGYVYHGFPLVEALQAMNVEPRVGLPEELSWIHRQGETAEIFFISNQGDQTIAEEVDFLVSGHIPELWDPETGRKEVPISWREKRGRTYFPLMLHPGKSVCVVFEREGHPPEKSITKIEGPEAPGAGYDYRTNLAGTVRFWKAGSYVLHEASEKSTEINVDGIAPERLLDGPWELSFQRGRGAPEKVEWDRLLPWQRHPDPGIRYFSGTGHYRTEFQYEGGPKQPGSELWLDLGELHVIAELRLNGEPLRTLWHPPYRVEVTDLLRDGTNTLEVAVSNLWINRLIGDARLEKDFEWVGKALARWPDWLDEPSQRPSERIAFATWKHWGPDDALRPSGLLGPVVLREARLVEVD